MYSYLRYISSPRMQKIDSYTQLNPTNPLTHAVEYSVFFLAFSTRVAVAIIFFTISPVGVPSETPQPQALQLDPRRVNKRNQKVLSRAIHVEISSLSKIGGVVCEMPLKAPHICILDTVPKLSLFQLYYQYYMLHCCTIVHVMVGEGWIGGGWRVYCYCCTVI